MAFGSVEITCEDKGVRAVTVASGSQGVPVCKDQGVTPASARGTAQKTSVPVRDPVTEVGMSKVNRIDANCVYLRVRPRRRSGLAKNR